MFLMFYGALFTVTKIRKHHKCPPTDEQIKKWSITYAMEYYLATKNNKILSFA